MRNDGVSPGMVQQSVYMYPQEMQQGGYQQYYQGSPGGLMSKRLGPGKILNLSTTSDEFKFSPD